MKPKRRRRGGTLVNVVLVLLLIVPVVCATIGWRIASDRRLARERERRVRINRLIAAAIERLEEKP